MKHYLLHVWQPDGPPPEDLDLGVVMADVERVNDEMKAAGAWVFSGGLTGPESATVLLAPTRGGEVLVTDGPYVEGKEHLGGISLIKAADLDEAMGWARKIASAIGLPIEVRAFFDEH